ncbi:uncharacterized protein LOC111018518 [Momordica charantia]|uniref:Uncharacterized protein LOC111018518 n=1 Tax=Momordica charantia TaxID=3673 RepID=A0A6J1D860_MOMCH|nr:uncharacterized protein LOC111018518 [Momordica charantia]
MSPYRIVFGKACHFPLELEHRAYWATRKLNFDYVAAGEARLLQLPELDEFRQFSYENGKLKSRWSGPFVVEHVYGHGAVDLKGSKGNIFKDQDPTFVNIAPNAI